MQRPLTPLMSRYYKLARRLGLSHARGRAIYAANRHANLDAYRKRGAALLRATRPSTAQRWETHWDNGGSIHALRYTQTQWCDMRKVAARRLRETYARIAQQ